MRRIIDLQRAAQRPDKPGEAAYRAARTRINEQLERERVERFGPVTTENITDILDWFKVRTAELEAEALRRWETSR